MAFKIEIHDNDNLYVKLIGDLDINNVDSFKKEVLDKYKNLNKDIIFCLKDLDYIDSTGLGATMTIYKEVNSKGNKIIIKNAKKNVKKLFSITELDQLFIMED